MTPPEDVPNLHVVRCPTCRASQEWSDSCRRCRSDLRLLRDVAISFDRSRRTGLVHLRAGRWRAALPALRHAHELAPSETSLRLLAIAALLNGDFADAAALAMSPRPLSDGVRGDPGRL